MCERTTAKKACNFEKIWGQPGKGDGYEAVHLSEDHILRPLVSSKERRGYYVGAKFSFMWWYSGEIFPTYLLIPHRKTDYALHIWRVILRPFDS